MDISSLENMKTIADSNSWVHYFLECRADIQGWIDLEREIIPVLNLFYGAFQQAERCQSRYSGGTGSSEQAHIIVPDCPESMRNLAKLWPKYISKTENRSLEFAPAYSDMVYGLFEDKLIRDLKNDLDEFVRLFAMYLMQIVDKIEEGDLKEQISDLEVDTIVTFNYTKTYLAYPNLKDAEVYHIHGSIDKPESIIIGVNEVANDPKNKFIRFVKYFQRLGKRSDPGYRNILAVDSGDDNRVYVFGHSLDITDEDVLREFIDDGRGEDSDPDDTYNRDMVEIFYYDEKDYEQKVINLINLLGRRKVEQWLFDGTIKMKKIV